MTESPAVQCEQCDDFVFHDNATFEDVPGATLAFCPDCYNPTRSQELGLGR